MNHIDDERLTLLALGDGDSDARTTGHLAACPMCRAELDSLRTTVELGRSGHDEPDEPPPGQVWQSILTEVREPAAVRRQPVAATRSRWWAAVVAVAACLAGALIGGAAVSGFGSDEPPGPDVVASASLRALAGTPADTHGTATVVRVGDRMELRLDAAELPLRQGFYEVWMFDPATNQMQSMGILDPARPTTFSIPAGLDVTRYAGIDVSAEEFDGRPEHSTTSVLRGRLHR